MLKTGNAIALDLGKCGTSWLEAVLRECLTVRPSGIRHKGLDKRYQFGPSLLYTIIRNPYTYYVSHLTYSQKTNGPLWNCVSTDAGYKIKTVEQYVEEINVNRRKLPKLNHSNREQAAWENTDPSVGMQTMQYVLLADPEFILTKKRTRKEIEDWYECNWWGDDRMAALNNSNLEVEMYELFSSHQSDFPLDPNWEELYTSIVDRGVNGNVAKVQNLSHADHHTEKSKQIIAEYEDILIKRFNYTI